MRFSFLIIFFMFVCIVPSVSASGVYVPNTADSDLVNQLIKEYDCLFFSGDYYFDETILLDDNTLLQGIGNTSITFDETNFCYKGAKLIYLNELKNVTIYNLKINGGDTQFYSQHTNSGHDWENCIWLKNCEDVIISDVYFLGLYGDSIRSSGSENIFVQNCVTNRCGHDFIQCWGGNNWYVNNCTVNLFINSGVRFANSYDCVLENSDFYCNSGSGFCAVELEDYVSNIHIRNNLFHDILNKYGVAIATVHANGNVRIYNNSYYNLPGGFSSISGVTVYDYSGGNLTSKQFTLSNSTLSNINLSSDTDSLSYATIDRSGTITYEYSKQMINVTCVRIVSGC